VQADPAKRVQSMEQLVKTLRTIDSETE
jgi:hypothetical protein